MKSHFASLKLNHYSEAHRNLRRLRVSPHSMGLRVPSREVRNTWVNPQMCESLIRVFPVIPKLAENVIWSYMWPRKFLHPLLLSWRGAQGTIFPCPDNVDTPCFVPGLAVSLLTSVVQQDTYFTLSTSGSVKTGAFIQICSKDILSYMHSIPACQYSGVRLG